MAEIKFDKKLITRWFGVMMLTIVSFFVVKMGFSYADEPPISVVPMMSEILTGTATMDGDNLPGNDENATNDIVRSFDTILYTLSLNASSTDGGTYKNIKAKISATVENGVSADGRFVNAVFDSFWNGKYDLTARTSTMEKEITIVGTGAMSEHNIALNVQGASNGTELTSKFMVELISAEDEDGKLIDLSSIAPIELNTKKIEVSSKVNLSVRFSKSNSDLSVDFEKYTGISGGDKGAIKFHGLAVAIEPVNGRTNLIGSAYPTNNVTVKLSSLIEKTMNATGIKEELTFGVDTRPITIFDYGTNPNVTATEEHLHLPSYPGHLLSYDAITGLPASRIDLSSTKAGSVYDSGLISMANEADDTITLNFKNFVVADYAPTSTINSSSSTFNTNLERIFLVARFSDVIPLEALEANSVLDISLIVEEIEYEDAGVPTTESLTPKIVLKWQEMEFGGPGKIAINQSYVGSDKSTNLGGGATATGSGAALAITGQKIYGHSYFSVSAGSFSKAVGLQKWNPYESEYDKSRVVEQTSPYYLSTGTRDGGTISYGVAKTNDYSLAGLIAKSVDDYDWYSTPVIAEGYGKISAVKFEIEAGVGGIDLEEEFYNDYKFIVPRIVVGDIGTSTNNTPHISLAYMQTTWLDGSVSTAGSDGVKTYVPTVYNAQGEIDTFHTPTGTYGDTLKIMPYSVRISKTSDKKTYSVNDTVKWTVTPSMEANSATGNQTIIITDTLAKGSVYEIGSAKYDGVRLDPVVTKNEANGIITLTWTINNVTNANLKKITYETTFNQRIMTFNGNGQSSLTDKIIIESPGSKTLEKFRTYTYNYTATRSLEYGIYKAVDKNLVELNEEFTYTIGVYNNTALKVNSVTGIDILPKNGYLTTQKNGVFLLKSIVTADLDLEIYYTDEDISQSTDPNSVNPATWTLYTDQSDVEVTAIFFKRNDLDANLEKIIEVTIQPVGNKIEDIYQNQVFANSSKNSKVISNIVKTTVVGRIIEGTIWEDSNSDGLMDDTEQLFENVEVFLYRKVGTNLELVTENIQGTKLVENNQSNVRTNEFGNYSFVGLAAGTYMVGFKMPDGTETQEYVVTELEVPGDEEKTSKASNTKASGMNYLTREYVLPPLSEMMGTVYNASYINAGIVLADRPVVPPIEDIIDNPKTGDNIFLYIGLSVIGLGGLGYALILKKKEN